MRNIFPLLSGNEKLKALLGAHIAEGKLSHAYIFEGDDGSGKMTCALSAAASLACEKRNDALSPLPCGKCASCRKIFGLFSPDVHIVSPKEKKSIGVDAIRDITSSLYISPNENDYCVYIIDDAHLMTAQAQNALGMLGRADYLQAEYAWLSSQAAYTAAVCDYERAAGDYEWAVKGLILADAG